MEDLIVEPARKLLIPKFDEVKAVCLVAGAIGGGISGSGPSIFMLSEFEATSFEVEAAMELVYSQTGIEFNIYTSPISRDGVRFV